MRAVDIITKKSNGAELTLEEIEFFIMGFTRGEIPDYQAAAWAMAVLLNGMSARETTDLTMVMANSGDVLDLSSLVDISVDKHSTGGVGDKTSLVVLPVVAACGLPVAKMSGRGLGFSGGTLDKMESIPGLRVDLSVDEFKHQLEEIGIVLTGQTMNLAPADGKLYSLRDVTGTVPSIPLIASSILSKKIASGAEAVVMDVKVGLGAFMETLEEARKLADQMISIGELSGKNIVTLIADMNQPLGNAVGNALEMKEAITSLKGEGPKDLREHCLVIASKMLVLGKLADRDEAAYLLAQNALDNGSAFDKFCELVKAQSGDLDFVHNPGRLKQAQYIQDFEASQNGFLKTVNARIIGESAVLLGAGRARKGDPIDYAVGIIVHGKVGDFMEKGQPLFTIHANKKELLEIAQRQLFTAFEWSNKEVNPLSLFYN